MNPSVLTKQLTLQIKTITQDAELNPIETWNDWRTVWTAPMPKTSKEYFKLQTMNNEITEVFKVRYNANINSYMRVKFRNKYFDIIGSPINPEERNEELWITCKGVV